METVKEKNDPILNIIIVNYNCGQDLYNCCESIKNSNIYGFRLGKVIIVDNNSNDGSLAKIKNLNLNFEIINNEKNFGFSKACNIGSKNQKSDYILFLNPDIILNKDNLTKSIALIKTKLDIGVCGIQLRNNEFEIQRTCCNFPKPINFFNKIIGLNKLNPKIFKDFFMENWDHKDSRFVDHVIGAFYLIRAELFFKLKGFDESFFMYLEDLDLSKRVNKSGYKIYYFSETSAYHKGGGSSEKVKDYRIFYSIYSRVLYGFKYFNLKNAIFFLFITFVIEPICRMIFCIFKFSKSDIINLIKGYILLFNNLNRLIKDSFKIRQRKKR